MPYYIESFGKLFLRHLYVHRKHKVVGNICQTSGQITVFVEAAYQITCELFCLFVCRCLVYLPEEILRKRLFGREYGRLHRIALPVEVVFYRIGSVIVVVIRVCFHYVDVVSHCGAIVVAELAAFGIGARIEANVAYGVPVALFECRVGFELFVDYLLHLYGRVAEHTYYLYLHRRQPLSLTYRESLLQHIFLLY